MMIETTFLWHAIIDAIFFYKYIFFCYFFLSSRPIYYNKLLFYTVCAWIGTKIRVSRWRVDDDGVDVREQEVLHDLEGRCNRRHGYLVVGGLFVAG